MPEGGGFSSETYPPTHCLLFNPPCRFPVRLRLSSTHTIMLHLPVVSHLQGPRVCLWTSQKKLGFTSTFIWALFIALLCVFVHLPGMLQLGPALKILLFQPRLVSCFVLFQPRYCIPTTTIYQLFVCELVALAPVLVVKFFYFGNFDWGSSSLPPRCQVWACAVLLKKHVNLFYHSGCCCLWRNVVVSSMFQVHSSQRAGVVDLGHGESRWVGAGDRRHGGEPNGKGVVAVSTSTSRGLSVCCHFSVQYRSDCWSRSTSIVARC